MGKISVSTQIKASVQEVWERWTSPEHIIHWNFASDEWHCPRAENDLRVGGLYKSRMEARNGSMGFDFEAIYDEVMPYKKIVYTMLDGRQAITTFEEVADSIEVTTNFDAEGQNSIDMQQAGWQSILENFKKYVEQ